MLATLECHPTPVAEPEADWRQLLPPWLLALGVSALLVAAGQHWPTPLLQQAWALRHPGWPAALALALVLLPPLALGLLLVSRMGRHHDRGESFD